MRSTLVLGLGLILLGCPGPSPSDGGTGGGGGGGPGSDAGTSFTCDVPIELRAPDGGAWVSSALLVSALDEDGRGIVAWSGEKTIEAVRLSATGVVGAPELVVPDAGGLPQSLAAAANARGALVAWGTGSRLFISRATDPSWTTLDAAFTNPYQPSRMQAAMVRDGGAILSWELNRSVATDNQVWTARELGGGSWLTSALTPGFTGWSTTTSSNHAGDFGGCYGNGWPPAQAEWFTQRDDGTDAGGVFALDAPTVICGVGARGELGVAYGGFLPGGRFVVTGGNPGAVSALPRESQPVSVRPAAGHVLVLWRTSGGAGFNDSVSLLTDDAGVPIIVADAGVSSLSVSPAIDEDGTVFFVSRTNFERPQVTVLRPPAWNPVPLASPFGARVGVEPVSAFTSAWGGGRGVIAWREGAHLFLSTCR